MVSAAREGFAADFRRRLRLRRHLYTTRKT